MARHIFTEKDKQFIGDNYLKMSSRQLGKALDCSRGVIQRYMRENDLEVPPGIVEQFRRNALKGRTSFTEEQTQFIMDNYLTMPIKTMGSIIGKSYTGVAKRLEQLNLSIPREIIEQRKNESRFKKGRTPENKGKKQADFMSPEAIERTKATRFQKGHVPHNYVNGEHLSRDGYIIMSIGGGKQVLKHRYLWEQINGKVPDGHCLVSLDGSRTNTDPSNWTLITREENMLRNSKHEFPKEAVRTMALISKVKKSISKIES
ncbi:HNH endonuclease signature motif containing protein [Spongiimicrobium salis]|uniref:HNH endonuclease signature motif containing protein n=1 Tax=Spongiimicrobium salis TaxID=1667022 RepID=UPI00374DA846